MLTQRIILETSNFKAEINEGAKIPTKRRLTFEASRAVGPERHTAISQRMRDPLL
jgi:hypothetical protein